MSLVYMLIIWVGVFIPTQVFAQQNINYFRTNFAIANGEKDFQRLLNAEISDTSDFNANVIQAYQAVCRSAMAQYVLNPYTKYQLFNQGKEELEVSISKETSVENIFLRVVIQLSIPKFLGYHEEIEHDLKYLIENISNAQIPLETKKFIIKTIQETGNEDYDLNSLSLLSLNEN